MSKQSNLVRTSEMETEGTAPIFACRAWVDFNGTNGSIRASGNISSVSRVATGRYTINFETAMPDGNYSVSGMTRGGNSVATTSVVVLSTPGRTTTSFGVDVQYTINQVNFDWDVVNVMVLR